MVGLTFDKEIIDRLKKELALAEKLNNLHLYKIITCLLLIQEGEKFSTIAKQLNICCRTVYDWLKKGYVCVKCWSPPMAWARNTEGVRVSAKDSKHLRHPR